MRRLLLRSVYNIMLFVVMYWTVVKTQNKQYWLDQKFLVPQVLIGYKSW